MRRFTSESIFSFLADQSHPSMARRHHEWLSRFITGFLVINCFLIILAASVYLISQEITALLTVPMLVICCVAISKAKQMIKKMNYETAGLLILASFLFSSLSEILLIPATLPATILGPPLGIVCSAPYLRPRTLRWSILVAVGTMIAQPLLAEYVAIFTSPVWVMRIPLMAGVGICAILLGLTFKHYHDIVIESQHNLETSLLERTAEVQEREQLFQAVSNLTSDFAFVMHIDLHGRVTNEWENDTISALTGYRGPELRARGGFQTIIHPDDRQLMVDFYRSLVKGQHGSRDCRIIHANGSLRWLRSYAQPVTDKQSQRVMRIFGAMQDITASKEHQQQITDLAFYDSLTGLSNRRLFHDHMNALLSLASDQPFSVLFLDLDRFKRVNDTLGHDIGDALLIQVAKRLHTLLRPGDTIARLGGDEFAVLLLNTHDEQAFSIGERLLNELEVPFQINSHKLHISGSIGVASYPKDGNTINLLLKHADIAMYRAKGQGSQVVSYDEDQFSVPQERLELEAELRSAIDNNQMVLFFQPIHDLYSGEMVRAEVLVRWQHPRRGLLLPGTFIHIAEESGLIRTLDRWIIRHALQQCAMWYRSGIELPISVNISAQLLGDPTLIEEVQVLVEMTEVPTKLVMVEITETAALQDIATTMRVLEAFKKMGMLIALDDFGTGHASLGRLKHLPVNVLKVDHEFTAGINHNPKDEGVLQAVATLAHGLKLTTIVEGIETIEQHEWLCEAGFEQGQGFLLAHPMSADKLMLNRAEKDILKAALYSAETVTP